MMKPRMLFLAILSIVLLLAGFTVVMADPHLDVTLKDYSGVNIGTRTTVPYSPKMSCSGCHINNCIATHTRPDNTTNWCETEAQRTALGRTDDYGMGESYSTHVQGSLAADNTVYWQAYQNKSFAHGASVGRHMNEGRNESYTNANRAAVGDPWFTSSFGMWGKY